MAKIYTKANVQNNNPATPVSAGTMAIFDNGIDAIDTKTQNLPTDGTFDPANYATTSYVDNAIDDIELQPATTSVLGGVKPDGITILVDPSGVISSVGGGEGGATVASVVAITDSGDYFTSTNVEGALQEVGAALETIPEAYELPIATTSVLGGVKPDGTTITIDASGVISSVGGGGGSSDASDINITDAGSYFTSTNVEGALQELGAKDANLQTQINGKQATITGAASSIVTANFTPARIAYFDDNGKIAATGAVTTTHLSYLIGVTSNIQTQLDARINNDGWNLIAEALIYASADSPTFVVNTSADLTSKISVGMKLKLTQTSVKYFFVVAITSTTITLYGGTDYTLANATISNVYFSSVKAPYGFPLDRAKWTIRFEEATTSFIQSNPIQNTWYNMYSLVVPIGLWEIGWSGIIAVLSNPNKTAVRVAGTLSTTNNSETNNNLTAYQGISGASGSLTCIASVSLKDIVSLSNKTTYYLNIRTISPSADVESLATASANQPTIIQAVCAYL